MDVNTETSAPPIKIVIVDDHPLASAGIAKFLRREPDFNVAAVCLNLSECPDAVQRNAPDVVIFEFTSAYPNGSGLLRAVDGANPDARVIVVMRHTDQLEAFREAGAAGFVRTDQSSLFLAACVRNVHQGATWIEYTGRRKKLTTPSGTLMPATG